MKRFFGLILSLFLAASLAFPACATEGGLVLGSGVTMEAELSSPPVDFRTEGNVIDLSGVLTAEEEATLEEITEYNAEAYRCGCYAIVLNDYYQFGDTASDAVINLYHGNSLGIGNDRDGILLMVDIINREFAFFVYGDYADYIFDNHGQEVLEQVFIDDLGENRWYDALLDFTEESGEFMKLASQGEPVRASKTASYGVVFLSAILIAAVTCFILLSQMKSVARGVEATAYVTDAGLKLSERKDRFLYKTTVTRDLSQDDDSGSTSFSGGGGSGRSGNF